MKILLINTSERHGGAAIACNRLTHALGKAGVDARMLVATASESDRVEGYCTSAWRRLRYKWAFLRERLGIFLQNGFSRNNLFAVSTASAGLDIANHPAVKDADVIHLHWVNQGYLSLDGLRRILALGKPVVWTMHDMWAVTGICHHAHECRGFHEQCGQCWLLRYPKDKDLSHKVFLKKQAIYRTGKMHMVAVSHWLQQQIQESALTCNFPSSVIPNTLSLQHFRIYPKEEARRQLGLPANKKILLLGAARIDDPIKGFPTLLKAIKYLLDSGLYKRDELHLAFFGKIKYPEKALPLIPIEYTDLGWVNNADTLSTIYSAGDITVSASLYETFGQTLIESLACGCLPVSFGNSGQADIIRHKANGYLAEAYSIEDLATGIHWGLTIGKAQITPEELRNEVLHKYSEERVAQQYIALYTSLLSK